MTELIFISAQPYDFKFTWQIDVQCWNFKQLNILDKYHILVWYPKGHFDFKEWDRLKNKYKEAHFYFYEDEGVNLELYIPQIRPHVLKRHFKIYEEQLKNKSFFYLDSDVIFRELPDFNTLLQDDICWQSNTSSYLDYRYLKSKEVQGNIPEYEVLDKLAEIGGITTDVIKSYETKTGGAQYILKNIDWNFWEDVERTCIQIRKYLMQEINTKYFPNENAGFQSWCADMWAVNFALWKRNLKTDIHKELEFTWASDRNETWFQNKIYHDAGAGAKGMFIKSSWNNVSPVGKNISVLKSFANWHYVEFIKTVK